MTQKLFIPTKIRVGFQKRNDTFTGQLAYVIYYDEKGKLRKETSWDGWRDHKIEPVEYDNTPRNSYVLNKGIQRYSDWGSGRSVIRVHDPRNFEFEISVDNLIGILMHSDVSKRDIVEECVFAWAGTELVLLPVNSVEYQESVKYTEKQSNKVSTKELKLGFTYAKKKSDEKLIYIGYYPFWETRRWSVEQVNKGKRHVFYDGSNFVIPSVGTLSHVVSEEVDAEFSNLVEKFNDSLHAAKIVKIENAAYTKKGDSYYVYMYKVKDNDNFVSVNFNVNSYDEGKVRTSSINFHNNKAFYTDDGFKVKSASEIQHEAIKAVQGYASYWNRPHLPDPIEKSEFNQVLHTLGYSEVLLPVNIVIDQLKKMGFASLAFVTETGKKKVYKND